MNYIWEFVIETEKEEIPKKDIKFLYDKKFSPYMEINQNIINDESACRNVNINPYYRFYEIFKDLFNVNNKEDFEFRNVLFDILVHFIADIDVTQGMDKHDYYIDFIYKDIKKGIYGEDASYEIEAFDSDEKYEILGNVLKLYKTGEAFYIFKDVIKSIFKKSILYLYSQDKSKVVFFANALQTPKNINKFKFIRNMFLPVNFSIEVYWNNHFGVIGVSEVMKIDKIEIC